MADSGKSSIMKFILIVFIILIVDAVAGYFITKMFLIPYAYKTAEYEEISKDSEEEKDGEKSTSEKPGPRKALDAINLNPANSTGEIFSCSITLEARSPEVISELDNRDPQIKSIVLTYFRSKTVPELNDVSQQEKYIKDLMFKINSVLTTGEISYLYITDWIVQFD